MSHARTGFILLALFYFFLFVNGDGEREVSLHDTNNIENAKNRSKIHLTIELEDKDSNKGNFVDLSKGKIQNITIQAAKSNSGKKIQPDAIDKNENEESKIGYDNLNKEMEKEGNRNVDGKDRRRKQLSKKEKFSKEKQLNKRKDRKSVPRPKRKERKHKKKNLREKKQRKSKQQTVLKKRKEKQQQKKNRKQRRLKQKSRRKSKQKKNLKYISNPDGGPNPKNLKIPLTFLRKDIQTGSNQTKHEANMNISQTNQEIRTANITSNSNAVKNLRHLTKQIVTATLKELTTVGHANKDQINSTANSNQGTSSIGTTNEATKPKPNVSSPLELRMRKGKRGMRSKIQKLLKI